MSEEMGDAFKPSAEDLQVPGDEIPPQVTQTDMEGEPPESILSATRILSPEEEDFIEGQTALAGIKTARGDTEAAAKYQAAIDYIKSDQDADLHFSMRMLKAMKMTE